MSSTLFLMLFIHRKQRISNLKYVYKRRGEGELTLTTVA